MNKLKNFAHAIFIKTGFAKEVLYLVTGMLGFFITMTSFGWIVKLFLPIKLNPTAPYIFELFAVGSFVVIILLLLCAAAIILCKFYKFLKESWENS